MQAEQLENAVERCDGTEAHQEVATGPHRRHVHSEPTTASARWRALPSSSLSFAAARRLKRDEQRVNPRITRCTRLCPGGMTTPAFCGHFGRRRLLGDGFGCGW